jgi:hypothetical protein
MWHICLVPGFFLSFPRCKATATATTAATTTTTTHLDIF